MGQFQCIPNPKLTYLWTRRLRRWSRHDLVLRSLAIFMVQQMVRRGTWHHTLHQFGWLHILWKTHLKIKHNLIPSLKHHYNLSYPDQWHPDPSYLDTSLSVVCVPAKERKRKLGLPMCVFMECPLGALVYYSGGCDLDSINSISTQETRSFILRSSFWQVLLYLTFPGESTSSWSYVYNVQ